MIKIQLEGMCVAKQSFRANRNVFMKDKKVADYQKYVASIAKIHMGDNKPLEGPLSVCLIAYFEIKKSYSKKKIAAIKNGTVFPTMKPDCDNLGKGILDAMNKIVYNDDSQIVHYTTIKRFAERPYVLIYIGKMGE